MRYTIVIEKSPRNYAVYVPDLPGCVATGGSEGRGSPRDPPGYPVAYRELAQTSRAGTGATLHGDCCRCGGARRVTPTSRLPSSEVLECL